MLYELGLGWWVISVSYYYLISLTPRVTGAGARSTEGADTGHENAEGLASVGVGVEPTVRQGRPGKVIKFTQSALKNLQAFRIRCGDRILVMPHI